MAFKFERLGVWHLSMDYIDAAYNIAAQLPEMERFNLASQLRRTATSVALNIAEGSTGQSDAEQARFLGLAIRSLVETVACLHIIKRRGYLNADALAQAEGRADLLVRKLQAFRRAVRGRAVHEENAVYEVDDGR